MEKKISLNERGCSRPVRRGGSRGFGRTPFLAGYTYYLCDDGRLEIRDCSRITYAHRKVSDLARLWGSHCMRERE